METSQLLSTNVIVSEVRSRISSWIGLGLESMFLEIIDFGTLIIGGFEFGRV